MMRKLLFVCWLVLNFSNGYTQSYEQALSDINDYFKSFDKGYYGYLEIKDGYLYEYFKKPGEYCKVLLEDLDYATVAETKRKIVMNCKSGGSCLYSTFTDSYHTKMSFSKSSDFNTEKLITLLNRLLDAYKESNSSTNEFNNSNANGSLISPEETSHTEVSSIYWLLRYKAESFSKETISSLRKNHEIKQGMLQTENKTPDILEVMFYHSDAPDAGVQFMLELEPGEKRYLADNYGKNITLGNDWGVQFKYKNEKSPIFLLKEVYGFDGNRFQLSVNDKIEGILFDLMLEDFGTETNQNEPTQSSNPNSSNEVIIGKQVWMAKNLNVDRFRNGDPIPESTTEEEWVEAGENGKPAWCYYENDPANGAKYGKLYNWYAVNDPRGLAPKGWHIPSDAEWTTLTDYLGGETPACPKMKSKTGWKNDGNGTNESGFLGLPGGGRNSDGSFYGINGYAGWWSSSKVDNLDVDAWHRSMDDLFGFVARANSYTPEGSSVRCVKD